MKGSDYVNYNDNAERDDDNAERLLHQLNSKSLLKGLRWLDGLIVSEGFNIHQTNLF